MIDRSKFGSGSTHIFRYLDQITIFDRAFNLVCLAAEHISSFDQRYIAFFRAFKNAFDGFVAYNVIVEELLIPVRVGDWQAMVDYNSDDLPN